MAVSDKDLLSVQEARQCVEQAYEAYKTWSTATQQQVDQVCAAMVQAAFLGAERLGRMAADETGFGVPEHKKLKNEFNEIENWSNYFKLRSLIRNKKDNPLKSTVEKYLAHNVQLYENISQITGKKIIVDSSRNLGRLLTLLSSDKIEMYTINITRDPRAAINSLIQKDIRNYNENRQSTILNILNWNIKNILTLDIMKNIDADMGENIFYKDFSMYPAQTLQMLEKRLKLPLNYEVVNGQCSINLEGGHIISGNRNKFNTGKTKIIRDIKWKKRLGKFHKVLISIGSLPLYKYLVRKK